MKKRLLNRKRLMRLVLSLCMILLYINVGWGQQTIGSFPYINGGFEGQSALLAANNNGSSLGWTSMVGTTNNSAIVTSGARTGNNYAKGMNTTPTATSNFRALQSPTGTGPLANTTITIQFYYRNCTLGTLGMGYTGSYYSTLPNPLNTTIDSTWRLYTATYNSTATSTFFTLCRSTSAYSCEFDDVVVYAGSADTTAPSIASVPTATGVTGTQQTIGWTASPDVDGGGYMVVRGLADPSTAPNANGIYAVGNTVAAGETVVYLGTNNSFTDTGLAESTPYYYRIYTVDKAFNYSSALTFTSTTAGAVVLAGEPITAATSLVFSNVTGTGFDISWTAGSGSNSLVVVKAVTDVNADPTDGTIYTPSLTFGSGTQIGAGNYTVYKGAGTTASITGLSLGTTYFVKVYTFNVNVPGSENYLNTAPASGSKKAIPAQSTFTFNATTEGYTAVTRLTTPVITTESSNGVMSVTPAANMNNLKGIITNSTNISRVAAINKYAHVTLKNTSSFDRLELGVTKGGTTPTYISAAQNLKSGDIGYTTYDFDLTTWDVVDQFPSIAFSRAATWSVSATYANGDIVVDGQTFYQKVGSVDILTNPRANTQGDWVIVNGDAGAGYPQTGALGNAITTLPIYIDSIVYDNVIPTIVSNGTGGGTWGTGSTWAGGIAPTSTLNVTILSGDTVNSTATRTINQITINGTLNVSSTSTLTVTDAIANNGNLTIANNSNLVQTAVANTNSGSGTATVNRNSNPLFRLDYSMWSSPVSGAQTLADFSPLTSQSPNRFFTYNPATNLYSNVSPTSTFSTGSGYLIRMPNTDPTTDYDAGLATLAYPGQFTGTLNNGTLSVTTALSGGYYSVGNPYPSTIDAAAFLGGNTTDGTLYFWRKTNAVANSTGSAYATWTTFGSAASNVAPNDIIPNGTIQVGQGFIVKSNGASLSFTNAMRLGTASTQFFKTKQIAEKSRVWLNLTNTVGAFSQALVGYVDGATLGVDNGIDGKYINDSAIALTSNINGEEYTIQGRPAFDATDMVALNFKTDVAGDYTIAIDHTDGIFATGQDIYLLDSKTGIETDLKAGSYTFAAATGVDNTRFTLKYQKTLKVDDAIFNENNVTVYAKNGSLYVNSGEMAINTIQVYDVQGRLIAERNNVKATTATLENLKANNQVLLVKVLGENNKVVTKKVVN